MLIVVLQYLRNCRIRSEPWQWELLRKHAKVHGGVEHLQMAGIWVDSLTHEDREGYEGFESCSGCSQFGWHIKRGLCDGKSW